MIIDQAKCTGSTPSAIIVKAPFFDEPEWIPQSQITDDSEVWKVGDEGNLVITDWFAKKKGWLEE